MKALSIIRQVGQQHRPVKPFALIAPKKCFGFIQTKQLPLPLAAMLINLLLLVGCQSSVEQPKKILTTNNDLAVNLDSTTIAISEGNSGTKSTEPLLVEKLLGKMTLQEKVGQMIQAEIKWASPEDVKQYHLGSVLNGGGSHPNSNKYASLHDWRQLARSYFEHSIADEDTRAAVPILWGTDAVHGHNNVHGAVIFPHNIGLGAANNPALTRAIFAATAKDVQASGIKWAFSPTVAVARDDRWGRTYESFSEDPRHVSIHAREAVLGLQGTTPEALSQPETVIATAKHFIGDGGTHNGIDQGDTLGDEQSLLDIHGQSFVAAIDANAQTVMASFNSWNGEKIHGHKYALNTLLKEKLGFDGFVIGDWNGHAQVPGCSRHSCAQAINAGIDMLMAPEDWKLLIKNTVAQVESGEIAMARIDDAVARILAVKYRAGLFAENSFGSSTVADITQADSSTLQTNRALARQAVRESLVLLKNNNNTLPLNSGQRILVLGDAANSIAQQTGGWTLSWQGNDNSNADFPNGSTMLDGITDAVTAAGGSVAYFKDTSELNTATLAQDFDAVIYAFGEQPYAEGVGDMGEVLLPNKAYNDLAMLQTIAEQDIPLTTVLLSGRPLSSNAFINASDAFVVAWLPGSEGAGVADVLLTSASGEIQYDFSGKLAFSWPESSTQVDINNYPNYNETPLFEFGYGLSYSDNQQLAALTEHDKPKTSTMVITERMPIFSKKVHSPWSLYVGDEDNWSVMIQGNQGSTTNERTVVISASDNTTQEDARKLRWLTDNYGQVYFSNNQAVDISKLAESNGALHFNVRVETPPAQEVMLRMDCHYPCSGGVDLTKVLQTMPSNQWQSVSVNLNCFAQSGAELSQINTPFLIGTAGELSLEVSHIVIAADEQAGQQINCPASSATLSQVALPQAPKPQSALSQ